MPKNKKLKSSRDKNNSAPVKVTKTTNDQGLSDEELRRAPGGVGKRPIETITRA